MGKKVASEKDDQKMDTKSDELGLIYQPSIENNIEDKSQ